MADTNTTFGSGSGEGFVPVPSAPEPLATTGAAPPLQPEPVPPLAPQETFVVPTQASSTPFGTQSQVSPQIFQDSTTGAAAQPEVPMAVPPQEGRPGSQLRRRMLMIAVFLVLFAGLFVLGKWVLGFVQSVQEVTITYWGLWENEAVIRPVIADFEAKNPKIKVLYVKQSHRQYRERLQAAIARGEGPDVFRFHNTWVPMLRSDLAVVSKAVMTPEEFSQEFYPIASADLVGGSNIYGIPMMIDGLGLYVNEDLFEAAGATPPTTWEELLSLIPILITKTDTTITTAAIALGTTGNVEHFSDILATMMMQNGVRLTEPAGKEAEEALIFYRKFADPSDPVYTWNETLDNSIYAFAMGKVAMILAPSWRAFDIRAISPDLRFRIVPIPQLPGNTVTWASYWAEGVSAKSKQQEAAWKFLRYLTSRDAQTRLYTEAAKTRLFGEPYSRVDLASGVANDPYVGAYIKQAQNAKSFPLASRTFDNGLNDKLIKYLEDAVNATAQGASAVEALQTAAAGFRQVLGTYGLSSGAAPTR